MTTPGATGHQGAPVPEPSAPRRIYLDQNAWIQLSQQDQGKTKDPLLADALREIRGHAASGRASFPLSGSHYMETYKRGDPASRQRLGRFMFSIAGLDRIADGTKLLIPELHTALSDQLNLPAPPPAEPFGRGFAHVFPEAGRPYDQPVIGAAVTQLGRQAVEDMLELQMLAGPGFGLPDHGIARQTTPSPNGSWSSSKAPENASAPWEPTAT